MKSTELRLNNWVLFVPQGKKANPPRWVQVAKIKASEVTVIDKGLILVLFHDASLQAIPLTPEILEKAGFEHYKGVMEHNVLSYFITPDFQFWVGEVMFIDKQIALCKLTSVHQLQNLYFALTGEELTISL